MEGIASIGRRGRQGLWLVSCGLGPYKMITNPVFKFELKVLPLQLYQVIREEFMGIGWLMETESKAENKKNGNLAMKMSMLASPYEPIRAQWTSEFCAVCFHPYDQTENRLMFCIK